MLGQFNHAQFKNNKRFVNKHAPEFNHAMNADRPIYTSVWKTSRAQNQTGDKRFISDVKMKQMKPLRMTGRLSGYALDPSMNMYEVQALDAIGANILQ